MSEKTHCDGCDEVIAPYHSRLRIYPGIWKGDTGNDAGGYKTASWYHVRFWSPSSRPAEFSPDGTVESGLENKPLPVPPPTSGAPSKNDKDDDPTRSGRPVTPPSDVHAASNELVVRLTEERDAAQKLTKLACAKLAGYKDGFEGMPSPPHVYYNDPDENMAYTLWFNKARGERSVLIESREAVQRRLKELEAALEQG